MAEVFVKDDVLHVELTVPERVLSLHGRDVSVRLSDIAEVRAVDDALASVRGLRMPGAGLPGKLAIGIWRGRENHQSFHDFVLIHRAGPGVLITTTGGDYARILIGSNQPDALVAQLRVGQSDQSV
jgi:hypothetical protein